MRVTKNSKLGTTLLMTTVIAALFALPQTSYGLDRLAKQQAVQKKEHADLQARTIKGIIDPVKFLNAVKDPVAILLAAVANGNLSDIFAKAIAVVGSTAQQRLAVINPHNAAIAPYMKAAVLQAISLSADAADAEFKNSIKTALGLDHSVDADTYLTLFMEEAIEATYLRKTLNSMPGASTVEKIENILNRLNAGNHKASDGTAAVGGAAPTVHAALVRLGL